MPLLSPLLFHAFIAMPPLPLADATRWLMPMPLVFAIISILR
jgi:hypothetical protein